VRAMGADAPMALAYETGICGANAPVCFFCFI